MKKESLFHLLWITITVAITISLLSIFKLNIAFMLISGITLLFLTLDSKNIFNFAAIPFIILSIGFFEANILHAMLLLEIGFLISMARNSLNNFFLGFSPTLILVYLLVSVLSTGEAVSIAQANVYLVAYIALRYFLSLGNKVIGSGSYIISFMIAFFAAVITKPLGFNLFPVTTILLFAILIMIKPKRDYELFSLIIPFLVFYFNETSLTIYFYTLSLSYLSYFSIVGKKLSHRVVIPSFAVVFFYLITALETGNLVSFEVTALLLSIALFVAFPLRNFNIEDNSKEEGLFVALPLLSSLVIYATQ